MKMDFIKWNNPDADFYHRLHQLLSEEAEAANSMGVDWLKEKLLFKTRHDFRVETGLAMLDRFGVTEGSLEQHNLKVVAPLPAEMSEKKIAAKVDKNVMN